MLKAGREELALTGRGLYLPVLAVGRAQNRLRLEKVTYIPCSLNSIETSWHICRMDKVAFWLLPELFQLYQGFSFNTNKLKNSSVLQRSFRIIRNKILLAKSRLTFGTKCQRLGIFNDCNVPSRSRMNFPRLNSSTSCLPN